MQAQQGVAPLQRHLTWGQRNGLVALAPDPHHVTGGVARREVEHAQHEEAEARQRERHQRVEHGVATQAPASEPTCGKHDGVGACVTEVCVLCVMLMKHTRECGCVCDRCACCV